MGQAKDAVVYQDSARGSAVWDRRDVKSLESEHTVEVVKKKLVATCYGLSFEPISTLLQVYYTETRDSGIL